MKGLFRHLRIRIPQHGIFGMSYKYHARSRDVGPGRSRLHNVPPVGLAVLGRAMCTVGHFTSGVRVARYAIGGWSWRIEKA